MADEKILVVDDDVGMLTLVRQYLTREGYDVTTAPSAATALQLLAEHEVAAVLTDLRLPGMDGMGLVREIHATRPDTQVLLMTAFGSIAATSSTVLMQVWPHCFCSGTALPITSHHVALPGRPWARWSTTAGQAMSVNSRMLSSVRWR